MSTLESLKPEPRKSRRHGIQKTSAFEPWTALGSSSEHVSLSPLPGPPGLRAPVCDLSHPVMALRLLQVPQDRVLGRREGRLQEASGTSNSRALHGPLDLGEVSWRSQHIRAVRVSRNLVDASRRLVVMLRPAAGFRFV